MPAVESVVFDIGETLLDDSREFGAWADWRCIDVTAANAADAEPSITWSSTT